MAIALHIIRYGIALILTIVTIAHAAETKPKKQTVSTIRINNKTVTIRCAPKPSSDIDSALAEKINNEHERIYKELEQVTTYLINKEVEKQGIPLETIKNESWNLADMSDSYAEQIYLLGDELAEITARLVRIESNKARSTFLLHNIFTRISIHKLTARKTHIENKIADLISVRIELEGGIEKNQENTEKVRAMIATTFKTPHITELEELLAAHVAEDVKARAFCKEQASQKSTSKKR